MSGKEIKVLYRRWAEKFNRGKAAAMDAIDELYATDYIEHGPTGEDIHGIKDYKKSISELFSAFPDLHFTLDDMVVEGDKAAIRYTFTGTHKGEFMGCPPTNKKWTIWGIFIDRIASGKFAESWVREDTLGFMQQLGLIPTSEKGR